MKRIVLGMILTGYMATLLGACAENDRIESVDAKTFEIAITQGEVQLVDVRTPAEYAEGHIDAAININMQDADFVTKANELLNKEEVVYVYCRSGGRSMKAALMLSKEGYRLVNLKGGMMEWNKEGKKVIR